MVDAGLCWDTATAIRRAKQFEPFDLTWLEEPLHPDNLQGYAPPDARSSPMRDRGRRGDLRRQGVRAR